MFKLVLIKMYTKVNRNKLIIIIFTVSVNFLSNNQFNILKLSS